MGQLVVVAVVIRATVAVVAAATAASVSIDNIYSP